MALELLSLLCTFENSSRCIKASFNSDCFLECLKDLLKSETGKSGLLW